MTKEQKERKIKELSPEEFRDFARPFTSPFITEVVSDAPNFISDSQEFKEKVAGVINLSGARLLTDQPANMGILAYRYDVAEQSRGGYPINADLYLIKDDLKTLTKVENLPKELHKLHDLPDSIKEHRNKKK